MDWFVVKHTGRDYAWLDTPCCATSGYAGRVLALQYANHTSEEFYELVVNVGGVGGSLVYSAGHVRKFVALHAARKLCLAECVATWDANDKQVVRNPWQEAGKAWRRDKCKKATDMLKIGE